MPCIKKKNRLKKPNYATINHKMVHRLCKYTLINKSINSRYSQIWYSIHGPYGGLEDDATQKSRDVSLKRRGKYLPYPIERQ